MTQVDRRADPDSRRVIDLAVGILMGLRECSESEAFDDLVDAVHETGVGPAGLAAALKHVVGGSGEGVPHQSDAIRVWGHLLTTRSGLRDCDNSN